MLLGNAAKIFILFYQDYQERLVIEDGNLF